MIGHEAIGRLFGSFGFLNGFTELVCDKGKLCLTVCGILISAEVVNEKSIFSVCNGASIASILKSLQCKGLGHSSFSHGIFPRVKSFLASMQCNLTVSCAL